VPGLNTVRRHLLVSGRVQGVWFRGACAEQARALGVAGWARNLPDGSVEVVAEGDAAGVGALERWCHRGPPSAEVSAVTGTDQAPEDLTGFYAY
jgi:acylphosphatase